jgi:murein DD-endopeptidase MepM/ murein hydrolase activator NlpD
LKKVPLQLAILLFAGFLAGCSAIPPKPTPGERISRKEFRWPLEAAVSSGFGSRPGGRHGGIDLLAPAGTPIRAAERGVVSYAGNGMRGYGNVVVLDHGEGLSTLYGHLETIRVKSAEVVPAGAAIGTVGRTGNATTNHLHFELRIDGEAVDPVGHLKR